MNRPRARSRSSPATSTSTVVADRRSSRSSSSSSLLLVAVMLMIWFERKVIADMQNRIGPQPRRALRHPPDARRRHQAVLQGGLDAATGPTGPCSASRPYLVDRARRSSRSAIVPIGGDFADDERRPSDLRPRHLPAARRPADRRAARSWPCRASRVYGVMLAGWSSGSKYPLLGSVRASAQMLSYEAALGLVGRRRAPATGHALDPRHRRRAGVATASARIVRELEPLAHRRRCRSSSSCIAAHRRD